MDEMVKISPLLSHLRRDNRKKMAAETKKGIQGVIYQYSIFQKTRNDSGESYKKHLSTCKCF